MVDLLALADRVEKLTGPDRKVDAEIARIMQLGDGAYAPAYSSSLDAAITLVPEGWTKVVDASAPECGIDVELFSPDESAPSVKGTHPKIGEPVKQSEAIALTAASLRARASTDKGEA